jgi:hypothetical protein
MPPSAVPTRHLEIVRALDRDVYGPEPHIAPGAKACLLVEPRPLDGSLGGLMDECIASPYAHLYTLDIGDTRVHVSWEGEVWMIELNHPITGKPPQVLGLGCCLIVAPNPVIAVYLAKLCVPTPVAPFEWISYH